MKTSDFDYYLPETLIAQKPISPREKANLMVLHKSDETIEHRQVADVLEYLKKGDILVLNNTKVFKARLQAIVHDREHEVFLLRHVESGLWESLIGRRKKVSVGDVLEFDGLSATVKEMQEDGVTIVEFDAGKDEVLDLCRRTGDVPLPPYITSKDGAGEYQTVYAKHTGSVAAPTAGFHLTEDLLKKIEEMGVQIEYVTLHVGLGTFRPVKTDDLESHKMHAEWVEIAPEVGSRIVEAKKEGRRVIAVGTTSVRSLEGSVKVLGSFDDLAQGFSGEVNLFIKPGFDFQVIDGMMTNFHLPKSTLIVLVSAFAGREFVLHAYSQAVEKKYRFYSFGDAMLFI